MIKDKAHFFLSVERVMNDRAPPSTSRPGPSSTPRRSREDRVWNTLVRFDHQINAKHSWNVRWLRENLAAEEPDHPGRHLR